MLSSILALAVLPTIWIVDGSNGPGASFTDLPPAIAAAQSGDTIILRPGSYTHFSVSGKALTIRGEGSSNTIIGNQNGNYLAPATTIDSVPAGAAFYIDGVSITFIDGGSISPPSSLPSVRLTGAGSVLVLADVHAFGPLLPGFGGAALSIAAGEAHAVRSTFAGGFGVGGPFNPASGGPGVRVAAGGAFSAESCTFVGGNVSGISVLGPKHGGPGAAVSGGAATIARSSLHGGSVSQLGFGGAGISVTLQGFARVAGSSNDVVQGGTAGTTTGPAGAGAAIAADATSSAVVHGTVTLLGGSPIVAPTIGPVTADVALPGTSVTGAAHPSGELYASQVITVTIEGIIPGAPFVLGVQLVPSYSSALAPALLGELLLPLPGVTLLSGTLDAAGSFVLAFNPAVDAPSILDLPIYVQVAVADQAAGQHRASGLTVLYFRP
jgi:hypothetical protein